MFPFDVRILQTVVPALPEAVGRVEEEIEHDVPALGVRSAALLGDLC